MNSTHEPDSPGRSEQRSLVHSNPVVRVLWGMAGLSCVGVGALGVVVPGLPTAPLFILAAWFFARSSPRLERWVLGLRGIGPMVADHRAGLGMPRRAKVFALTMMAVAVTFSVSVALDAWLARVVVISLGAVGAAYVTFRVPTRERVVAARAATSSSPPAR